MPPLKINDILTLNKGRYRIIENLPGGGQGNVWKAEHDRLHFALKIPLNPKGEKRAAMEIGLMSKISQDDAMHHFIAPCCDTGTYNGLSVLVTPFYPDNLENHMPVSGSKRVLPTASQCLRWLEQILCALQKTHSLLHDQGKALVHRDIRAANLCLDHNNHIRLIDFGIAKDTHELSTFTTAHCEQAAAPEQRLPSGWKNDEAQKAQYELGVHVDIYALGLIGFRLFTGAFPNSQRELNSIEVLEEHFHLLRENQIGLLGKIGGLSDKEQQQLHRAIEDRLEQEQAPLADKGAFSQKIVEFVVLLLNPRYQNRPSVDQAKRQINTLISELTCQPTVEPSSVPSPQTTDKSSPVSHLKPLATAACGIALLASLGWQWPRVNDTIQLWRIGQQLHHGSATESLAAWRDLNNRVSVSGSTAAADILADFEEETQHLLNSKQPADQRAAINRLRLSAEKGDQNAMLWLAYVKIKGQGTEQDWQEAEQWYQKAAAFNNPEAKKRLQRLRLEMKNRTPASGSSEAN